MKMSSRFVEAKSNIAMPSKANGGFMARRQCPPQGLFVVHVNSTD
jgi:hypothetical protein